MTDYGQPRRLNIVTITLLLMGLAAGYWLWRFFPAYFDGWTVDHILRESAARTYKLNQMNEPGRTQQLKAMLDKTRADIQKQANVTDPELVVNLDILDNESTLSADYSVIVTHPLIDKTTTLHFHKVEKINIKRVQWE